MSLGVLFIVTLWLFLSPNTVIALLWFSPHANDLVKAATGTVFFLCLFFVFFFFTSSFHYIFRFINQHVSWEALAAKWQKNHRVDCGHYQKEDEEKRRGKKERKQKGRQPLGIIVLCGYADRVTDVSYRYATYCPDFP